MIYDQSFRIRPLIKDDLSQALALSSSEGWNQTEKDWRLLIENPLNTCIAADYEDRIIGTATVLNHNGKVAWIGMVIVDKAFRGQGIGKLLMTTIIEKLRNFESLKLDATPAGLPLYRKLGFAEEYMIDRMLNLSVSGAEVSNRDKMPEIIRKSDFPGIVKADESVFGTSRYYLLDKIITDYPEKALKLGNNKILDGYILGRNGLKYNYMGPVVATSEDSARILIAASLGKLKDQPVILDIPQDKKDLINWLESLGFQKQRHFTRMFLKSNYHKGIAQNYYLISGPEYG